MRLIAFPACKESIAALKALLRTALSGQLRGLALCYWGVDGQSVVVFTGIYRAQPVHALGAAALIKFSAARQLNLFA